MTVNRRKSYPSRIFFLAEISLVGGIALGDLLPRIWLISYDWSKIGWLFLSTLLSLMVLAVLWPHPRIRQISFTLVLLLGGVGLAGAERLRGVPAEVPFPPPMVEGTVETVPTLIDRSQRFLLTGSIGQTSQRIQVYAGREPRLTHGMRVVLRGTYHDPFDVTNAARFGYFEVQGIQVILYAREVEIIAEPTGPIAWLNRVRSHLLDSIQHHLPEPAAALAAGLALGIPPTIDPVFTDALRRTNLTHLAAVSGQNLAITVFLLYMLIRRRSLAVATVVSCIVLLMFGLLVGADASIIRASLLGGAVLLTPYLGRPLEPIRLLLFAATLMVIVHPLALTYDLGFQLSFLAFLGIILIGPGIERYLHRVPAVVRQPLAALGGATCGVLPVQLIKFGTISLVGPLANILVVPLVPIAMIGALFLAIGGALASIVGSIIALGIYLPLELIHWTSIVLAQVPFGQVALSVSLHLTVSIAVGCAAVFSWLIYRRLRQPVYGGRYDDEI